MTGSRSYPIGERFWKKVDRSDVTDGCWRWLAARYASGYGSFGIGNKASGTARTVRAHRLAWELTHGPIPSGKHVLHKCDNTLCCNPAHLFLGDQADNVRDMWEKGRGRVPEPYRPPRKSPTHGTVTAYTYHACRCDKCREGHRLAQRAYRARRGAVDEAEVEAALERFGL